MLRRYLALSLSLVLSGLLLFGRSPVAANDDEGQLIAQINATRVRHGLPTLAVSPQLTAAARDYARTLAAHGYCGHRGPDGSTFISRAEAAGYLGWTDLKENLAAGQVTAAEVVAGWLGSPSHRDNLLSPDVHELGVGVVVDPASTYEYYWVLEMGRRPAPVTGATPGSGAPRGWTSTSWLVPTGYLVQGLWLDFVRSHGDVDTFGLPTSEVLPDPTTGQPSQLFQRALLDWHPENPPSARITPRLLGDLLFPGADPPVAPDDAPPGPSTAFPLFAPKYRVVASRERTTVDQIPAISRSASKSYFSSPSAEIA